MKNVLTQNRIFWKIIPFVLTGNLHSHISEDTVLSIEQRKCFSKYGIQRNKNTNNNQNRDGKNTKNQQRTTMSEISYTTFPFEKFSFFCILSGDCDEYFFEKCLEKLNDYALMFEFNS